MAEINYLWIGLVMGLFLIVVVTAIGPLRGRVTSGYRSPRGRLGGDPAEVDEDYIPGITPAIGVIDDLRSIANKPVTWMVTFVGLAVMLTVVGLLFVGGFGAPEEFAATGGPIVAGILLAMVTGYILLATYISARRRGHPNAHALAESMGVLSLVLVAAVAARLVFF